MIRMSCAVPARPRIRAGSGRCSSRSYTLPRLHGASTYSSENRPPMFVSKYLKPKYMSDQREHEARHRQADEADERDQVVADGVLADRGVDADRQGEHPREEDRGHRDDHRQRQAVADHLGDRAVPLHRHPEVARAAPAHPAEVLDEHGLVEPVLLRAACPPPAPTPRRPTPTSGRCRGDVVARRQLDDDERQHGDRPHREQREDQPLDEIREHGGLVYPGAALGPPPGGPHGRPGAAG